MIHVSTYEAKARWSELLRLVEQEHECIVVSRHGKPIAEITACRQRLDPLAHIPELAVISATTDVDEPIADAGWAEPVP